MTNYETDDEEQDLIMCVYCGEQEQDEECDGLCRECHNFRENNYGDDEDLADDEESEEEDEDEDEEEYNTGFTFNYDDFDFTGNIASASA